MIQSFGRRLLHVDLALIDDELRRLHHTHQLGHELILATLLLECLEIAMLSLLDEPELALLTGGDQLATPFVNLFGSWAVLLEFAQNGFMD